jgi:DNA-binding transcriptional LysR family regulator
MNLRGIDLNLLVVLNALTEERSVRRAGARIGLSQSATSHALARLRGLLGDELLVRTATGMEPTPRALALAGPIRLALEEIQATLAPDRFDPATASRAFTIVVETYGTIVIVADMVDRIRQEAPGIDVTVRSGPAAQIIDDIDKGRADIAIGSVRSLPGRFVTRQLMADRHVCLMRAGHPLAGGMTLAQFLGIPHLLVSMNDEAEDLVDHALAAAGLARRVAFRLPNGLAAVAALLRSDMLAVVSEGAARMFAGIAPLVIAEPPLELPATVFRLVWNRRLHESAGHVWLRRVLAGIGQAATHRTAAQAAQMQAVHPDAAPSALARTGETGHGEAG